MTKKMTHGAQALMSLMTEEKNRPGETAMQGEQDRDSLVKVWVLRGAVFHLNRIIRSGRIIRARQEFDRRDIETAVAILNLAPDEELSPGEILARLKETLEREKRDLANVKPDTLFRNVSWLGKALKLSLVEQAVLYFAVKAGSSTLLIETLFAYPASNVKHIFSAVAFMINIPRHDVEKALSENSPLIQNGFIDIDFDMPVMRHGTMDDVFRPNLNFANRMLLRYRTRKALLQSLLKPSAPPRLCGRDFSYFDREYRLALEYLKALSPKDRAGVNFLIHGDPGVGKTEMVRSLCAEAGLQLFEVPCEEKKGTPLNKKGAPLNKRERITQCLLSARILAENSSGALLFDEIEDAFPFGGAPTPKAWVNSLLENNPTPTFWLSNSVRQIDPAFIRRFDVVLHVPRPPRQIRRRMLSEQLAGIPVGEDWINRTAECRNLTPAHIERAAKVTNLILGGKKAPQKMAEEALRTLITNTLEAQGEVPAATSEISSLTDYNPDWLNTDISLDALINGLRKHHKGRLCFYGPPGTGKTAFARYLARSIGKPLLAKGLNEILNPFVGVTEKNIAAMFREAESEDAVLLLDEADSLLRDRDGAVRGWEVMQVNQMLTSMECFDGVFIASTNLMDCLDKASLRRFDCKIRFNALEPDQAWRMFLSAAKKMKLKLSRQEAEALSRRVKRLSVLTPGDFNTVLRKQRLFDNAPSVAALIESLERECEAKRDKSKPIGFVA